MIKRLLLCAAVVLSACSSSDGEPTGLQSALAIARGADTTVTPRFMALQGTPRPLMQIGLIDAGTAGTMVLEARNGPYEHYISPNAASMTFNRGMLTQTYGFGEALVGAEVSQSLGLILRGQSGSADRTHTYLGGDDRQEFRTFRCTLRPEGMRQVQLPNRNTTALFMRENCRNAEFAFENIYWVEQGRGEIIQSRQWAGPNLGAVSTRRAGLSNE
ncbi:MAG: YjbF family lipoprotein [Pseudomonadota bacterium]